MKTMEMFNRKKLATALSMALALAGAAHAAGDLKHDDRAVVVDHDPSIFSADPTHEDRPYSVEEQLKIYGDKKANVNPRPLVEHGRRVYDVGVFPEPSYIFGRKNPVEQQFLVYGDWRTAVASNDFGNTDTQVLATRLNLDLDWKLTATERVHAIVTPLQDGNQFTRYVFGGNAESHGAKGEFDPNLDALFLEGDLGAIAAGFSDQYNKHDIPFAIGLMPLFLQNGVWMDDAFIGAAVAIPARNSAALGISNYDISFFAGFDEVTTNLGVPGGGQAGVNIFGATAFLEANEGYWELGYAYSEVEEASSQNYHNVTGAFTRRYGGRISNSVRVIGNFGQESRPGVPRTADGALFLVENSLITHLPSTLIPYLNVFYGIDTPQSVARAAGAGGVLKNTGILFETDGLTGFPTLDATGNNTYGGAIGVQYLFALNQQVVVEAAMVEPHDGSANSAAGGSQWGLGVRWQRPLDRSWIVRADAMYGSRENRADVSGVRLEIRRKF